MSPHITLGPHFREREVDSYLSAFECIAVTLKWPKDIWSLLLICKFVRQSHVVCAGLSIDQSIDYDVVKALVLRAHELVPEVQCQTFGSCDKSANIC